MEPDAVQAQNKPFECRVILRRCSKYTEAILDLAETLLNLSEARDDKL